jgi:hypothetical protein
MQILALSSDPVKAAQYLMDTHLNSTIHEAAQMMSTVHWMTDCDWAETLYASGRIYAPSHENHPCTRWIAGWRENLDWVRLFAIAADKERRYRFPNRQSHKSAVLIKRMFTPKLRNHACGNITNFVIGFRSASITKTDPIKAYRQYYMTKKRHLAKWTRRGKPWWWED